MPKNGNHTGQQSSKEKAGSGHRRQRLAPNDLGGVGETSPPVSPPKEGDNSTKPELNHVQSTTVPVFAKEKSVRSSGKDNNDAGSSSADSVRIQSASNSDIDSSEEEEGGNRQGPHKKNSQSAHSGAKWAPVTAPVWTSVRG